MIIVFLTTDRCTVLVSGLPKAYDQTFVELLFENEARSGGGPIKTFSCPAPARALITYEQAVGESGSLHCVFLELLLCTVTSKVVFMLVLVPTG